MTPTTQGKAHFFDNIDGENLEKKWKSLESPFGELAQNTVPEDQVKYCIIQKNKYRNAQERLQVKGPTVFYVEYQEDIQKSEGVNLNSKDPIVRRYGIKTLNIEIPQGYHLNSDELHYVEKKVLKKALKYLDANQLIQKEEDIVPDSEPKSQLKSPERMKSEKVKKDEKLSLRSVVAIDFFKRVNGVIGYDKEGAPEVHCVLLWMQDDSLILFDPNTSAFSAHLIQGITKKFDVKTRQFNGADQFYLTKNGLMKEVDGQMREIETDYCEYGESYLYPRDCIDIAIKVGFEILELEKENLCFGEIEKKVLLMSNSSNAKGNVYNAVFLRELQSTKKEKRREAINFIHQYGDEAAQITGKFMLSFVWKTSGLNRLRQLHESLRPFITDANNGNKSNNSIMG